MAKSLYKPLLFTTTLRNPERMKDFIRVLAQYDGKMLSNDVINDVVYDLISKKLYVPLYVRRNNNLNKQLDLTDTPFSYEDTKNIIANSPQNHKEAGFDKGWPSRFDTWYKFFKELGFVYYKMNERIQISESGSKLVMASSEDFRSLERKVFLNAFVKYQRVNPYLKVLNNNKPLILLLKVIRELKKITSDKSKGISISEIPLLLCWRDDNFKMLSNKIIEIRKMYGFNPSREVIYSICKDLNGWTERDEKRFKINNIVREMPDEFIRKMRLTGIITLRGMGRFIDENTLEKEKIDYILENYSQILHFSDDRKYFDYMSKIDPELVDVNKEIALNKEEKNALFMKWVSNFGLNTIKEELHVLSKNSLKSKDEVLKYIGEALRFEFLTALALQKKYEDITVNPNYCIDDEGLPTSFAIGNTPDIVCTDNQGNILFEVTLIVGTQQCIREMNSIARHLLDVISFKPNSFSVFLAPKIHIDTINYAKFMKFDKKIDIKCLDISEFILSLDENISVRDYYGYENETI